MGEQIIRILQIGADFVGQKFLKSVALPKFRGPQKELDDTGYIAAGLHSLGWAAALKTFQVSETWKVYAPTPTLKKNAGRFPSRRSL